MRKKLCILISVSMMALMLAACGSKDASGTPSGGNAGTGVTATVEPTATKAPTEAATEAPEPKATNTPAPTATPEPTKAPDDFQEVALADTEILGLYWREEYMGYEYGWVGQFMVINSDGTVYQWTQTDVDDGASFDAQELRVTKVTTCTDFSEDVTHAIYLNDEYGEPLYYGEYWNGPFVANEYDFEYYSFCEAVDGIFSQYYVPDNVVYEKGNDLLALTKPSQ